MTIGQIILNKRQAINLTQAELAERVGVAQPFIARIEKGIAFPSVAVLLAMADCFNCSTDELLGRRAG